MLFLGQSSSKKLPVYTFENPNNTSIRNMCLQLIATGFVQINNYEHCFPILDIVFVQRICNVIYKLRLPLEIGGVTQQFAAVHLPHQSQKEKTGF